MRETTHKPFSDRLAATYAQTEFCYAPNRARLLSPKKVRPAPGGEPAARTRSGDGEGWGRDRARKLLFVSFQREVAVAGAARGSPSETQRLGSVCDCRLTKR